MWPTWVIVSLCNAIKTEFVIYKKDFSWKNVREYKETADLLLWIAGFSSKLNTAFSFNELSFAQGIPFFPIYITIYFSLLMLNDLQKINPVD